MSAGSTTGTFTCPWTEYVEPMCDADAVGMTLLLIVSGLF